MKKEQQKSLNGKTFITRLNYKVAVLQSLPHTSPHGVPEGCRELHSFKDIQQESVFHLVVASIPYACSFL